MASSDNQADVGQEHCATVIEPDVASCSSVRPNAISITTNESQVASPPTPRTGLRTPRKRRKPPYLADGVSPDQSTPPVSSATATNSVSTGEPTRTKSHRPLVQVWSLETINSFFEAIKVHGKDFDAILNYLGQRLKRQKTGRTITQSQVRNYYYNTLTRLYQALDKEKRDLLEPVAKETKELYLMVNFGEYRKKIGVKNFKLGQPTCRQQFMELVFNGVTRVRRRKGLKIGRDLIIRTPFCNALKKLVPGTENIEEMPTATEIKLQLTPRKAGDRDWILLRAQNPYLRMAIAPHQPVSSVLNFLERKWGHREDGISALLTLSIPVPQKPPKITLYPTRELSPDPVVLLVRQQGFSGLNVVIESLHKSSAASSSSASTVTSSQQPTVVDKEQQPSQKQRSASGSSGSGSMVAAGAAQIADAKSSTAQEDFPVEEMLVTSAVSPSSEPVASEVGDRQSEPAKPEPSSSSSSTNRLDPEKVASVIKLDTKLFINGIETANVGCLTVGELYLMNGRKEVLEIEYSICDSEHIGAPKQRTWEFFKHLLNSDFVDSLNQKLSLSQGRSRKPAAGTASSSSGTTAGGSSKRFRVADSTAATTTGTASVSSSTRPPANDTKACKTVAVSEATTSDFMKQLGSLQVRDSKGKRSKRVVARAIASDGQEARRTFVVGLPAPPKVLKSSAPGHQQASCHHQATLIQSSQPLDTQVGCTMLSTVTPLSISDPLLAPVVVPPSSNPSNLIHSVPPPVLAIMPQRSLSTPMIDEAALPGDPRLSAQDEIPSLGIPSFGDGIDLTLGGNSNIGFSTGNSNLGLYGGFSNLLPSASTEVPGPTSFCLETPIKDPTAMT